MVLVAFVGFVLVFNLEVVEVFHGKHAVIIAIIVVGSEWAIFLSFDHPCTLLVIIVFSRKILHFKQITETTLFEASTHLRESFRLLFFVNLGQIYGMDAVTPKISILLNAIIISVADVIWSCSLFRFSCLRRGSYSCCALMLLHLVLE